MNLSALFGKNKYETEPDAPKPPEPSLNEKQAVELVMSRVQEGLSARSHLEGDWATNIAFEDSHQWVEWDQSRGGLKSIVRPSERHRYLQDNVIRTLVQRNVSKATQNSPSSVVSPNTMSPMDQQAASEARDLLAHIAQKKRDAMQLQDMVRFALICTSVYLYQFWNPALTASIPDQFDEMSGEPISFVEAPVGDYDEIIVPGPELILDPNGRQWDLSDARWCVHAQVKSIYEIEEKYGKLVQPDTNDSSVQRRVGPFLYGLLQNYAYDSSNSQIGLNKSKASIVYTFWERPSKRAPKGRVMVVASGTLLAMFDGLPCGDYLPFVALGYQGTSTSPYTKGLVTDVKSLQMAYNRTLSRILERMEYDKLTVIAPSGIAADALEEQRHMRKVYLPPSAAQGSFNVSQPPPINPEWFTMLQVLKAAMEDRMGSHEVDRGQVGGGVTAGYAIRLLQDANNSQHATFYRAVENFVAVRDMRRVEICAKYYREPRQIGIPLTKTEQNPQTGEMVPVTKLHTFEALRNGGRTRISVVAGSATPKSPEAHNQEIKEFYQIGMFGPPGDPRSAKIAVDLLQLSDSDKIHEALEGMLEEQITMQEQQMQLQQVQALAQAYQATQPPPQPAAKK